MSGSEWPVYANAITSFDRYLPQSDRDRPWGMYVTGAGFGEVPPGGHYPRNGHPSSHEFAWRNGRILQEYQIIFIKKGKGRFQSHPSGPREVDEGTVIVLFPGIWHRYCPLEATGWVEYWVGFAGKDAERLQARGFLDPAEPILKTGADEQIAHAFTCLIDRMRAEPLGFELLIAASLWEIVAAVVCAVRVRQTSGRHHDLVRRAKMILENETGGGPVVEGIAATLGLSTSRFQHLFKEQTGLSPYQYHLQLKIQRARRCCGSRTCPSSRSPESCTSRASTTSPPSSRRRRVNHPVSGASLEAIPATRRPSRKAKPASENRVARCVVIFSGSRDDFF